MLGNTALRKGKKLLFIAKVIYGKENYHIYRTTVK